MERERERVCEQLKYKAHLVGCVACVPVAVPARLGLAPRAWRMSVAWARHSSNRRRRRRNRWLRRRQWRRRRWRRVVGSFSGFPSIFSSVVPKTSLKNFCRQTYVSILVTLSRSVVRKSWTGYRKSELKLTVIAPFSKTSINVSVRTSSRKLHQLQILVPVIKDWQEDWSSYLQVSFPIW